MAKLFEGKVALITGASSGIGRVTAQIFSREGAKVVVSTDKNIKGLEDTVRLIQASGGEAIPVKCDVSVSLEVQSMVNKCVQTFGHLDYAFNNAGIGPDGKRIAVCDLIDLSEEEWDRTLDVNLKGVWLCMKYEILQMIKQKHGAIVNTSSVGGLKGTAGLGAYSTSKHGLIGLTKSAALEYAKHGIRINAICPGPTDKTLLFENLTSSAPGIREKITADIPLGRPGLPEEMAEAVIWLCSDAASFITGNIMPVDGGLINK